jgi:uncharacterized damage-inducible protein DinB
MTPTPEWWQRGPVTGVPEALQPVAHMLLQLRDEVPAVVAPLSWAQWNARPAGVASVAFHVRHIGGVLDRLFTYARGATLTDAQFAALKAEGAPLDGDTRDQLLDALVSQIESRLDELRGIDSAMLAQVRTIGRAQLPSTVLGCLVHGAEHGMRHLGQLVVTARVVAAQHGVDSLAEGQ